MFIVLVFAAVRLNIFLSTLRRVLFLILIIYLHNDGEAIREFTNAANAKEKNIINTNPEDKEIWKLGEFDDQTGEITSEIRFLIKANDCIKEA